jgi:hypothetical protein
MKVVIISNNPMVRERYLGRIDVRFVDGSYRDVLLTTRDECHLGHRLLSHPLSGSIKPNETPYKSIMISREAERADRESIELMEKAIFTAEKFGPIRRNWRDRELKDFQFVDLTLIDSAVESAMIDLGSY